MEGDELIGVPLATAARVIGVTEQRLRRWARRLLVVPSQIAKVGHRVYRTYGLEDLVQGRVVRRLEDRGTHVRTILRVVEALRSPEHPQPLASLAWATGPKGAVYIGYPDGQWAAGLRPTEAVMPEVLELEPLRVSARKAIRRPAADAGHVERRRSALGRQEVFAGTRIPVSAVQSYLVRGTSDRRILRAFPDLKREDLDLARERLRATA